MKPGKGKRTWVQGVQDSLGTVPSADTVPPAPCGLPALVGRDRRPFSVPAFDLYRPTATLHFQLSSADQFRHFSWSHAWFQEDILALSQKARSGPAAVSGVREQLESLRQWEAAALSGHPSQDWGGGL